MSERARTGGWAGEWARADGGRTGGTGVWETTTFIGPSHATKQSIITQELD